MQPPANFSLMPTLSVEPFSAPRAWWLVCVLVVVSLVSYSDRMILSVLVDQIRVDLRLSDSNVGFLQGPAFTIVYVFSALVFGRLADRMPRKPILCAGVLLWCVATILCGLAPSGGALLAGRMLLGVGESVLLPTAFSMSADAIPPHHLGVANGTLLLGTIVGGPLGITLGGLLLTMAEMGYFAHWPLIGSIAPWRCVLVVMGGAGCASLLLLASVQEPGRSGISRTPPKPFGYLVTNGGRLAPLYATMALLSIGDYGLVSWVPTALSRRYAWSSDHLGVVFGVVTAAAGVLGSLFGGWVADKAETRGGSSARLGVATIFVLFAAAASLSICFGRAEMVIAGLGVWIFASSVASIGAFCVLQAIIAPEYRGTGVALMTFCNTLVGLGCGPTLVAAATEYVFRSPSSVDKSISLVTLPAAGVACAMLMIARATVQRHAQDRRRVDDSYPWFRQ